ncbi:class I SAM-dependent methyltransferase [Patescibacteria group bacterium]|nr:class I SAM-dependent methyltransferase [Patescibacteria group bacterium]
MNDKEYWDNKHIEHLPPKESGVTEFGQLAETYFVPQSRVLDLGAGAGMDSIYFAGKGHAVEATDLSDTALSRIREDLSPELADRVAIKNLDISKPFPYPDQSFDAVYASVSIHYFDDKTTEQVFSEIHRVIKPGGIAALMLNSKRDHEVAVGREIEKDYFEIPPDGIRKRYFDIDSTQVRAGKYFETLFLDDQGNRLRSTGGLEGGRD